MDARSHTARNWTNCVALPEKAFNLPISARLSTVTAFTENSVGDRANIFSSCQKSNSKKRRRKMRWRRPNHFHRQFTSLMERWIFGVADFSLSSFFCSLALFYIFHSILWLSFSLACRKTVCKNIHWNNIPISRWKINMLKQISVHSDYKTILR